MKIALAIALTFMTGVSAYQLRQTQARHAVETTEFVCLAGDHLVTDGGYFTDCTRITRVER